jgi:glutathione S-transferase
MRLVGMLDSPYVRRVAICLDALGIPFEHEPLSVFTSFERFRQINPVVKAPTLVCDDGGILMDSALILQYVEATNLAQGSPLWSHDPRRRLLQFRAVAFASAAADKAVQYAYEKQLRPAAAQHPPWLDRVRGQFTAAFAGLEDLLANEADLTHGDPHHASIWAAVVWQLTQSLLPDQVPAMRHPCLAQLSRESEASPLFARWPPTGPGVPAGSA